MSQITYSNKVTLDAQPDIADINKVTADDMNEIKNAHNDTDSKVNELINNEYCVATITTAQSISSNYKINLNSISRSNGNFTLANGGIVIGEGINLIRVSASIFVDGWAGGSNYLWGKILKNNTAIATSITGSAASYLSSSIPTMIIPVQENDVIELMADSGANGSLRSGDDNTYLCIEKIN